MPVLPDSPGIEAKEYTPSSIERRATATEEMTDSVRGVLQILRNKPGATFKNVRVHCSARGDDLSLWPVWIADSDGYVTEEAAAMMIYEIMAANAPTSAIEPRKNVATLARIDVLKAVERDIHDMSNVQKVTLEGRAVVKGMALVEQHIRKIIDQLERSAKP